MSACLLRNNTCLGSSVQSRVHLFPSGTAAVLWYCFVQQDNDDDAAAFIARSIDLRPPILSKCHFMMWPRSLQVATLLHAARRRGKASLALAALAADLSTTSADVASTVPPVPSAGVIDRESYAALAIAAAEPSSPLHVAQQVLAALHSLLYCRTLIQGHSSCYQSIQVNRCCCRSFINETINSSEPAALLHISLQQQCNCVIYPRVFGSVGIDASE